MYHIFSFFTSVAINKYHIKVLLGLFSCPHERTQIEYINTDTADIAMHTHTQSTERVNALSSSLALVLPSTIVYSLCVNKTTERTEEKSSERRRK